MKENTPKILIVDDEELNRNLLESMMELAGYDAACVSGGQASYNFV